MPPLNHTKENVPAGMAINTIAMLVLQTLKFAADNDGAFPSQIVPMQVCKKHPDAIGHCHPHEMYYEDDEKTGTASRFSLDFYFGQADIRGAIGTIAETLAHPEIDAVAIVTRAVIQEVDHETERGKALLSKGGSEIHLLNEANEPIPEGEQNILIQMLTCHNSLTVKVPINAMTMQAGQDPDPTSSGFHAIPMQMIPSEVLVGPISYTAVKAALESMASEMADPD